MELNRDLIQRRFQDIRQSLERLERIKELPREAFLSDQDTLDLACYRLLVAIHRGRDPDMLPCLCPVAAAGAGGICRVLRDPGRGGDHPPGAEPEASEDGSFS